MPLLKPKTYTLRIKLLIANIIALIMALIIIVPKLIPPSELNVTDGLIHKPINSSYTPDPPQPFALPPLGREPEKIIAEHDQSVAYWFEEKKSNPDAIGIRTTVYPTPQMREKEISTQFRTVWLANNAPFKAWVVIEPYFPTRRSQEQDFIFKGLLNGKELALAVEGSELKNGVTLSLKRGERQVIKFKTEPIPPGVHNLGLFFFDFAYHPDPDFEFQNTLGKSFNANIFKVYVGTTQVNSEIDFVDWSVGVTPASSTLDNAFEVVQAKQGITVENGSPGIPLWQPGIFRPGQKVDYTLVINNPRSEPREYCLTAFLNYNSIPLMPNTEPKTCGVVRGGQLGLVRGSFTVPITPGNHFFQVIRIENPLMKVSYLQVKGREGEQLSTYDSSGRIFLNVQP